MKYTSGNLMRPKRTGLQDIFNENGFLDEMSDWWYGYIFPELGYLPFNKRKAISFQCNISPVVRTFTWSLYNMRYIALSVNPWPIMHSIAEVELAKKVIVFDCLIDSLKGILRSQSKFRPRPLFSWPFLNRINFTRQLGKWSFWYGQHQSFPRKQIDIRTSMWKLCLNPSLTFLDHYRDRFWSWIIIANYIDHWTAKNYFCHTK